MHKKFADQGMAVITVALDDLSEPKAQEQLQGKALKTLKKLNMTFTNVMLDEAEAFWQEKFKSVGVPFVFVFNREGRYRKFDAGDIGDGYANVEKQVAEWVKAK